MDRLKFFPTLYPNESWYSVLCRYHIRSGHSSFEETRKELTGSISINLGTFFPNGSIALIAKKLPGELFNARDIILNHTPFSFYTMMYPNEEQEYILKILLDGKNYDATHLWKTSDRSTYRLKYCPMCLREDRKKYGEGYYHINHQIHLVRVCTKHKCLLKEIDTGNPKYSLNLGFYPLEAVGDERIEEAEYKEHYESISRVSEEYMKYGALSDAARSNQNIYRALCDKGYLTFTRNHTPGIDKERLYADLSKRFDEEETEEVFGKRIDMKMINKLKDFKFKLPDRYIYLQIMLGLSTEDVLGDIRIPIRLEKALREMAQSEMLVAKSYVARSLGVKEYEVDSIAEFFSIEKFWTEVEGKRAGNVKTGRLEFWIDQAELERIREEAKSRGFKSAGAYVIACVRKDMRRG